LIQSHRENTAATLETPQTPVNYTYNQHIPLSLSQMSRPAIARTQVLRPIDQIFYV